MLAPAEQHLVEADPGIPGLRCLMDPDAFARALEREAPGLSVESARVRYLRYKPGMNCLAAYELTVGGERVVCHAKAYRAGESGKLDKARQRWAELPTEQGGRWVVANPGIEVCLFPNDNKIQSLRRMVDPELRRHLIDRVMAGVESGWGAATPRMLAYKPERRYTAALMSGGRELAVIKLYAPKAYEAARGGVLLGGEFGDVRVARLLGTSGRRHVMMFEWLPGRLLTEAILDSTWDPAGVARVGAGLARFQFSRQLFEMGNSSRSGDDSSGLVEWREVESLAPLTELLSFLCPHLADELRRVAEELTRRLMSMGSARSIIHGDFYSKQVLLGDTGIGLIDLDEVGIGDPVSDLGTFMAHVERDGLCGRIAVDRIQAVREALVAGYESTRGCDVGGSVSVFTAFKLFARMPHFFRTREPDWVALTGRALERVRALLDLGVARSKVGRVDPGSSPRDERLRGLEEAMDPVAMERRLLVTLTEWQPALVGGRLAAPRVIHHKPGRRGLIEYVVQGEAGIETVVLGKIRAKGLDRRNYRVMQSWVARGFDAGSADGISIPTPLGAYPELGLWLQVKVAGEPVLPWLCGLHRSATARRVAQVLHKLHVSGVDPGRAHSMDDELTLLRDRLARVALRYPGWSGRLQCVADACARVGASVQGGQMVSVHRDFHPGQLLREAGRMHLLDLDLCALGDPALDVGNFIAHLIEVGIRQPDHAGALDEAASAFANEYRALNHRCSQESIEAWISLSLCRHIFISTDRPGREPFTGSILSLCEGRLGLAQTHH